MSELTFWDGDVYVPGADHEIEQSIPLDRIREFLNQEAVRKVGVRKVCLSVTTSHYDDNRMTGNSNWVDYVDANDRIIDENSLDDLPGIRRFERELRGCFSELATLDEGEGGNTVCLEVGPNFWTVTIDPEDQKIIHTVSVDPDGPCDLEPAPAICDLILSHCTEFAALATAILVPVSDDALEQTTASSRALGAAIQQQDPELYEQWKSKAGGFDILISRMAAGNFIIHSINEYSKQEATNLFAVVRAGACE